jgi:hypothetical protein
MDVSITYGSAYSFMHLTSTSLFEDVLSEIDKLKSIFVLFDLSKNNKISFSNDYSDFNIHGKSLEDHFLELTNDSSAAVFLLDQLEKIIGDKKTYLGTVEIESIVEQNENNSFLYSYPFTLKFPWLNLDGKKYIYDYFDVCNLNSFNFKSGIDSRGSFTIKAIDTYEHVQFSDVFEEKLKTIRNGSFINYLNEFSHALNVLNQAFFKVSNDDSKNEDDLNTISELSKSEALNGRGLDCTRQGANKPNFTFPKIEDPKSTEKVNCEYHLKLDYNDDGERLNSNDYVRVYFGLKYNDIYKRKYIRLAYIGEHWPPKKGGKKK